MVGGTGFPGRAFVRRCGVALRLEFVVIVSVWCFLGLSYLNGALAVPSLGSRWAPSHKSGFFLLPGRGQGLVVQGVNPLSSSTPCLGASGACCAVPSHYCIISNLSDLQEGGPSLTTGAPQSHLSTHWMQPEQEEAGGVEDRLLWPREAPRSNPFSAKPLAGSLHPCDMGSIQAVGLCGQGVMAAFPSPEPRVPSAQDGPLIWLAQLSGASPFQ